MTEYVRPDARSSVHVLMYIWEEGRASDRIARALIERAKAGVGCRILVDAFGSPDFDADIRPRLAEAGCEVRIFRPLPGYGVWEVGAGYLDVRAAIDEVD